MVELTARKEDRRIQRTRQLLRDALMALIVERGAWAPITIQDITDHANVSRTTFYLHFKDKDELLVSGMEEMYDALLAQFSEEVDDVARRHSSIDFDHVAQFADFYRVMLGRQGSAGFVEAVHRYLAEVVMKYILHDLLPPGKPPDMPLEFLAHYLAGAEIGLMRWWLNTGMQMPGAELARRVDELCMRGVYDVLGLSGSEVLHG